MALRLPPLSALRLFEAAARHQSFRKAAQELGLTPSAVSHGIVGLEEWLGVDLFDRGPARGVTLTEEGQEYLPYVVEALSLISVGTQRLPTRQPERRVSVSAAPTFAMLWLVPRLAGFRALHPKVSVSLDTSHRQMFLPVDGVDLAIRMGPCAWPGTDSILLMRERLQPVCSPEYRDAHARGGAADWERVTFLEVTSIENDWRAWIEASGTPVEIRPGLQFDTVQLAWEAAAHGLGVAMGRTPLVDDALRSGRLVAFPGAEVPIETGYWLVSSPGKETRSDIRAFKRWVLSEVGLDLAPDGSIRPFPETARRGAGSVALRAVRGGLA